VGADYIIRDTFLSSVNLAGEVLKDLGLSPQEAELATAMFRKHDEETLQKQYAIHHDEDAMIQSARDASQELRELFDADANR
jgi:voltage-gated potassium channel Kch